MQEHETKVLKIKEDIAQGRYQVDPVAVAEAIMSRLRELALPAEAAQSSAQRLAPQIECS